MLLELLDAADLENYTEHLADLQNDGVVPKDTEVILCGIQQYFKPCGAEREYIGAVLTLVTRTVPSAFRFIWVLADDDWTTQLFDNLALLHRNALLPISPTVIYNQYARQRQAGVRKPAFEHVSSGTLVLDGSY